MTLPSSSTDISSLTSAQFQTQLFHRVSEITLQKLDSFSSLVPKKVFLKVKHISSEILRSVSSTLQQFASFRSSEKQLIFISLSGPISKGTAAYSLLRVFSLRCSKSLKKFSISVCLQEALRNFSAAWVNDDKKTITAQTMALFMKQQIKKTFFCDNRDWDQHCKLLPSVLLSLFTFLQRSPLSAYLTKLR